MFENKQVIFLKYKIFLSILRPVVIIIRFREIFLSRNVAVFFKFQVIVRCLEPMFLYI